MTEVESNRYISRFSDMDDVSNIVMHVLSLKKIPDLRPYSKEVVTAITKQYSTYSMELFHVAVHLKTTASAIQNSLKKERRTFHELRSFVRLQLAITILMGDRDIDIIYLELCYVNPASFYRDFKKWTGITPEQFRQHYRTYVTRISKTN